ncbi:hypothetical protein PFISCL1PPCAC_9691, partial [Pristionchus fissidentatus]
ATMLARSFKRLGESAVRGFASSPRDPTAKYDFIPAEERDKGRIMDVTLNHFLPTEPHSVAFGIDKETGKELMDWIVSKSLNYPFSYSIVHKETGKTIGFRLMSVAHRDSTKVIKLFIFKIKFDNILSILAVMSAGMKEDIWKFHPEANKIVRRELTFVHKDHQRKGIAKHLLHVGIDFEKLRLDGYDGMVSEASSLANQTLLAKNGYKMLMESQRESYTWRDGRPIVFPDTTSSLQLYYLNLRK